MMHRLYWLAFACFFMLFSARAKPREVEDTVTVAGKKTQRWRGFHANGRRWYVHYWRNGNKVGTHRDFDKQGNPKSEVTYRRDLRNGPFKTWHPNGQLATRGQHVDNAESGVIETFHPNGKLASKRQYRDTLPDGPYVAWHTNGQKAVEGAFKAGTPIGTWTRWAPTGAVAQIRQFKAGRWAEPPTPHRAVGGDLDAADFRLFLITGGHFEGFDFQVWIHPNGWVDLLQLEMVPRVAKQTRDGLKKGTFYYDVRAWRSRLQLTSTDWTDLKRQLVALKPWSLPEKTVNPNVADGSQWYLGIRANGRTHRAYFDNRFSPEIKAFRQWLHGRLMSETYAFDRLTARPADTQRTWRRKFDFEP